LNGLTIARIAKRFSVVGYDCAGLCEVREGALIIN
jgi:hypothetical protein